MAWISGWNPSLGTSIRYDNTTGVAEAWDAGEGGQGYWYPIDWYAAIQIGAPFDPHMGADTDLAPVPDEKPWYDRILPGDQDSWKDLVPDFLEPKPGQDITGVLLDPFVPGKQDTWDDFTFADEVVEKVSDFDLGDLTGVIGKLVPLMLVMGLFAGDNDR